jgi:hypothetical protein
MSHEEEKNVKHLTNLENQGIDGSNVMGGGSGNLGIVEDNSNLGGMQHDLVNSDMKPMDPVDASPFGPSLDPSDEGPSPGTFDINHADLK